MGDIYLYNKLSVYLLEDKKGRPEEMEVVIDRLRKKIGNQVPYLETINFTREKSAAVIQLLDEGKKVMLGDLIMDPRAREKPLDLVVFVIKSSEQKFVLPPADYEIQENDQILFCGTGLACRLFNATINSEYKLYYIQHGIYKPRSYIANWVIKKLQE